MKAPELEPAHPRHSTLDAKVKREGPRMKRRLGKGYIDKPEISHLAFAPGFLALSDSHFLALSSVIMDWRRTGGWKTG